MVTDTSLSEYIEVVLPIIKRISGALPFDVYVKRTESAYTKVFPKSESIDQERLKQYEEGKGVKAFYVTKGEYRQYLYYVEKIAAEAFRSANKHDAEELSDLLKELVNGTMLEVNVHMKVTPDEIQLVSKTIDGVINLLNKDPQSFIKVIKYVSKHPYTMRHSIMTACFSILLAKSQNMQSDKALSLVGMGALLHDIGISQLEFDVEEKEELSPKDWKAVKEHPHLGTKLLDQLKGILPEVRAIVLQHHEQPNGGGYPNGLREGEIYFLAKVVAIGDNFSALISKRPFRPEPFTPLKAIEIMKQDRGKFDSKLLDSFLTLFVQTK